MAHVPQPAGRLGYVQRPHRDQAPYPTQGRSLPPPVRHVPHHYESDRGTPTARSDNSAGDRCGVDNSYPPETEQHNCTVDRYEGNSRRTRHISDHNMNHTTPGRQPATGEEETRPPTLGGERPSCQLPPKWHHLISHRKLSLSIPCSPPSIPCSLPSIPCSLPSTPYSLPSTRW